MEGAVEQVGARDWREVTSEGAKGGALAGACKQDHHSRGDERGGGL